MTRELVEAVLQAAARGVLQAPDQVSKDVAGVNLQEHI